MAEQFLNYRVELTLHDSTKIKGDVEKIDNKKLTMKNVSVNLVEFVNTGKFVNTYTIAGSSINDLSVVSIPDEVLNAKNHSNSSNSNSNNNNNNNNNSNTAGNAGGNNKSNSRRKNNITNKPSTPSRKIMDDAIIFQSNSTTPGKVNNNEFNDDAIIFAKQSKGSTTSSPKANNGKKKKNNNNSINGKSSNLKHNTNSQNNNSNQEEAWSEDVSNIQSKDFDFAGNLARFDKESIFKDLKSKDTVKYADRLAGHNKIGSPARKVNYENNEMILKDNEDKWNHIGTNNNSTSSLTKKHNTNSSTGMPFMNIETANNSADTFGSIVSENGSMVSTRKVSRSQLFSPVPLDFRFSIPSRKIQSLSLCSPVQLLDIERVSNETYGFTNALITENASIGISQLVIKILGGTGRASNNHNNPPLILLLVGNNKSGVRTLATGRRLTNKGFRVMAYILASNNYDTASNEDVFFDAKEEESENDIKQQMNLFTNFGGKVVESIEDLESNLDSLNSPLELIIDGLHGYDTTLADLWDSELDACLSLIGWANKSRTKILSLDIPSGLDGGAGQFTLNSSEILQSEKFSAQDCFSVKANVVVSLGLPIIGLLHAYNLGIAEIGDWSHYLVDLGIPTKIFNTKHPLRKFDKDYFGADQFSGIEIEQN